jgi:hypothetical protein
MEPASHSKGAALRPSRGGLLQRKCACGGTPGPTGECAACRAKRLSLQRRAVETGPASTPDDPYEREADRVAEEVTRSPAAGVLRAPTTRTPPPGGEIPPSVRAVLRLPAQPLDAVARAFFEARLGHDFGRVRVHTGAQAAQSARAVDALAYTVGRDVVFGAGQYAPGTPTGDRLLAHELSHVVQQGSTRASGSLPSSGQGRRSVLQRQVGGGGTGGGAVGGGVVAVCSIPSGCPPDFCTPFSSTLAAEAVRAASTPVLLAGIAAKVSSRVVPLWSQYLFGGASPQNLSGRFGADFTSSATTAATTDSLVDELRTDLESNPPSFPGGTNTVTVDLASRIGTAIAEIGDPSSWRVMDFSIPGEIPGNLAGGVGKNQSSCPVGARPSPFDDERTATGTADVTRNTDGTLTVVPSIMYTVRDTIDLCPGKCGTSTEQIATVPMSRLEASGISGDIPFTVEFWAPSRTVTARPPAAPPPPPPAPGPITGKTTASSLRIREGPSTSSPTLDLYPRGSNITILCQTTGTEVEGTSTWDKTGRGYVSDRYVHRTGAGAPPTC